MRPVCRDIGIFRAKVRGQDDKVQLAKSAFDIHLCMKQQLRIGTSGFHYKHWLGNFYPEKLPAVEDV